MSSILKTMLKTVHASEWNVRDTINFNIGWKYSPCDYENAYLRDLDDSEFENVSVPHANKILDRHKGPKFQREIESYRFISWYRRHFTLPETYEEGKRVIVEFEGVASAAEVYVNDVFVGEHKGAYTGFSYDITDYLDHDGDNVIAVRVDSTKRSDIPPEGGNVDYCLFGGIVRDVNLTITGTAYVENTFITTPDLAENGGASSRIHSEAEVINKGSERREYTVESIVTDADGNEVARSASTQTIDAGAKVTFTQDTGAISAPHLWTTDDAYLYTVLTRVKDGEKCIDEYSERIGFRWFEFTDGTNGTDGSFYLNGVKTELIGVNRHEQWPWIGRAVVNRMQQRDADLIKGTGFNAVRCSHYPQDPSFLDRCDELGLIVFEEAPGWQYIGDSAWQDVYKENLREMIVRDRNHPSIVTWGTRVNESADNDIFYTETNNIAKELDPTRPTHGTRRYEDYNGSHFLDNEDIYTAHYVHPETPRYTPFVITEHSNDWYDGHGFPWASDTDQLTFTYSFADEVNYYFGNDLCAGGFAWSMFDYNNEVNYTNTDNVFYSGVYDIFRIEKMPAYFYRSQKDPKADMSDAMVYISNFWTESSPTTVTVMSNCDEVELFVNGVSQGRKEPDVLTDLPHPIYEFDTEYEPGELRAIGYINGEPAAEYTVNTPRAASKLLLSVDDKTITADGADFTRVVITAVDENGTKVPYADNTVSISCDGCGRFIGEKNISLEGGQSAFFVQSKYSETGTIKCTVTADGMTAAECEIDAVPFTERTVEMSDASGSIAPIPAADDAEDGSFNTITDGDFR